MNIVELNIATVANVTDLALKLWPENDWNELHDEFDNLLISKKDKVYLAAIEDEVVGFIHMSLRVDYVEGSTTSPVGYIEAIYVEEKYRGKGISRRLIETGVQWVKAMGCSQVASDTELHNTDSQAFHKRIGFKEAGIIVTFIKDID